MNPPEHALVLTCDEKSQIQALNRTQPGLPMKRGRAGGITDKRIRLDSFTSVAELELAIDLYVAHHNIDPKPFRATHDTGLLSLPHMIDWYNATLREVWRDEAHEQEACAAGEWLADLRALLPSGT